MHHMKLSELIAKLESMRTEHGDMPVLMSGWNDTGHVPVRVVSVGDCYKTDNHHDNDMRRTHMLASDDENGFSKRLGAPFAVVVIEH